MAIQGLLGREEKEREEGKEEAEEEEYW